MLEILNAFAYGLFVVKWSVAFNIVAQIPNIFNIFNRVKDTIATKKELVVVDAYQTARLAFAFCVCV